MTLSQRFVIALLDALLAARAEDQDLPLLASTVLQGARSAQGAAPSSANLDYTVKSLGRTSGLSRFGALLRLHRLTAGFSQEALAERARMSANGIGALERGYRRTPKRQTLALLVDALRLDGDDRAQFESAARSARLAACFTGSGVRAGA